MSKEVDTFDQTCFIISPIGREGSDSHKHFREVLDFIIKPAVENAGFSLQVIRADDIERAGSFIKDILEYISSSHVVIADLTGQNPNVFYELGVRHSLSPRTILISQKLDDIPSDLREYRTVIYDTSARGATIFKERITNYLREIVDDPHRPDNPVLDRLESVIGKQISYLQQENTELRSQFESLLKTGDKEAAIIKQVFTKGGIAIRLDRILKIINAKREMLGRFSRGENGKRVNYKIPTRQGDFELFSVKYDEDIVDFLYISGPHEVADFVRELADTRVLMEQCSRGQNVEVKFIVVTGDDCTEQREILQKNFIRIKEFVLPEYQENFIFEIWDEPTIKQKEQELGIKLDDA